MSTSDRNPALTEGAALSTLRELLKVCSDLPEPEIPDARIDHLLYERYVRDTHGWKRRLYYALKPLIPRPVQIALRQRFVSVQASASFPAWPIEPILTEIVDSYLSAMLRMVPTVERLGFWPGGHRFAFAITHDVEWDSGLRRAPDLAAIEERLGFVSSWNLVPERYPIDRSIVDRLRADGFEIGIHGLKHDGKLFQSRAVFDRRAARINAYAREWKAVGFRSPSTLRNPDWMTALQFEYDSSFPDTDPYEPQTGGCCSVWPFFLGNIVELPLTMPQDHTLFEILNQRDIGIWKKKASWIAEQGGLVLINIHPDYMLEDSRLAFFEELLVFMKEQQGMWHTHPREIARWWRERSASVLVRDGGVCRVDGPASGRAGIQRHVLQEGSVVTVTPA